MNKRMRRLQLTVASWAFMGLIGIPALVLADPFGGWRWAPYNRIYDQMIVSIYMIIGVCSWRAIRRPLDHASFLWFVVWSSFAHGAVMLFHALAHPVHAGHLAGDVWILGGGVALTFSLRSAQSAERRSG